MKHISKTMVVLMLIIFLATQMCYANKISDWVTKSLPYATTHASWWMSSGWSKGVQNFATKSIYHDRLSLYVNPAGELKRAKGASYYDQDKVISACNMYLKHARIKAMFGIHAKAEDLASVYTDKADANFSNADYDQAISNTNKAIKLNPNDDRAYNIRGLVNFNKDNHNSQSISDFNKAMEIDPKSPLPYIFRAGSYEAMGKYQEALSDYTKAESLGAHIDPNHFIELQQTLGIGK